MENGEGKFLRSSALLCWIKKSLSTLFTMRIQSLTLCLWIAVSHSESEGEIQDNRPSISLSDLEDDSEEEF